MISVARQKMVDWIFHVPLSSHTGGVWERQIRTIRKVLVGIIGQSARMTDDILHTTMCVVENVINSRPITKTSDDPNDCSALTPNHLLRLKCDANLPWGDFHESDQYRKRWRQVQHLADVFWKKWLKQYLPDLQQRQKWHKVLPNLKSGDLVLMMDEQSPRGAWPMALVTDVNIGRDGLVRSARVKTRTSTFVRPVTKLVLLESACLE